MTTAISKFSSATNITTMPCRFLRDVEDDGSSWVIRQWEGDSVKKCTTVDRYGNITGVYETKTPLPPVGALETVFPEWKEVEWNKYTESWKVRTPLGVVRLHCGQKITLPSGLQVQVLGFVGSMPLDARLGLGVSTMMVWTVSTSPDQSLRQYPAHTLGFAALSSAAATVTIHN
jgi:hypothetical protein